MGSPDDATQDTASQLRDVVDRLTMASPGGPESLIVMDSGYDAAYLSNVLADLPVVPVGRLRSDRVMLRDAGPARSGPKGGRPRRHGGASSPSPSSAPGTARHHQLHGHHPLWHHRGDGLESDTPQTHPPRPWLEHADEELRILHGTLIRLKVQGLPGGRDPKPVRLWSSAVGATPTAEDRWWQSLLHCFDLEHIFRLMKQTLG